jgi:hypothetical protein
VGKVVNAAERRSDEFGVSVLDDGALSTRQNCRSEVLVHAGTLNKARRKMPWMKIYALTKNEQLRGKTVSRPTIYMGCRSNSMGDIRASPRRKPRLFHDQKETRSRTGVNLPRWRDRLARSRRRQPRLGTGLGRVSWKRFYGSWRACLEFLF